MLEFRLQTLPWNVIFGAGKLASLPMELESLGLERALVLSTPEQATDAARVASLLGDKSAGVFAQAKMHVPVEVAARAEQAARACKADCSVSIGGGSTTGLGKALAINPGIPLVAIPTTYAGSEMTCIWGMTEAGRKKTGRDLKVLPKLTIYDAELTLGLPPSIAGPSGMNALAQATINAKDRRTNPVMMSMALEAIRAISGALPTVFAEPDNLDAREHLLYGAALAGAALGSGVTSLHHRLCHTLGGSFNTPHAETHTVLLPYSVAYAAPAVPDLMAQIAAALDTADAAQGIYDLSSSMDLPTSLKDIGIAASDLGKIADIALESEVINPQPVTRDGVMGLLEQAYEGDIPRSV